jgi:hypothetical protein
MFGNLDAPSVKIHTPAVREVEVYRNVSIFDRNCDLNEISIKDPLAGREAGRLINKRCCVLPTVIRSPFPHYRTATPFLQLDIYNHRLLPLLSYPYR